MVRCDAAFRIIWFTIGASPRNISLSWSRSSSYQRSQSQWCRLAIGANLSPITMIMTMGMFSWTWCFQWKGGSVLQWMAIKIFTVLIDSDNGSFKCTWRGSIWENCRKRPRHRSPLLSSVSHSYTPHLPLPPPFCLSPNPISILSYSYGCCLSEKVWDFVKDTRECANCRWEDCENLDST